MAEQFIILPSAQHLNLLDVLSVIVLLIHLPYMGIVMGSTFFSLFFYVKDWMQPANRTKQLGKDILQIVPVNIPIFTMMGVLPLLTLMLVYSEWFDQTKLPILRYFGAILIMTIAGLFFIFLYHSIRRKGGFVSIITFIIGCIGVFLLLNTYYIFFSTLVLFLFPDFWFTLDTPVPLIFSWNTVARYLIFLCACCAFTGLGMLFHWFYWDKKQFDEKYKRFVRNFAGGISIGAVLVIPVCLLWDIGTMPGSSFSIAVYIFYMAAIFFLMLVVFRLFKILSQPELSITSSPFVLFLIAFVFLTTSNELAKENVNRGHMTFIADKAHLVYMELEQKRTANVKVTPDLALGEHVYKTVCSTCHAFDHKVVGPPHNEVLPKYYNDQDSLKKFILHPVKVNPAYPPMPPQPLNRKELESVVAYMMKHIEDEGLVHKKK